MEEKENLEFTLEDILKEFGQTPEEAAQQSGEETTAEQILEKVMEEVLEETAQTVEDQQVQPDDGQEEPEQEQPETELPGQTEAALRGDTVRVTQLPQARGTVRDAEHIDDEDLQEAQQIPAQEGTEPYSEQWEPEYEQPIAEYVPPRPILFHPRSRLRELKRKLVAGPERLYYSLSEKGLGKLQLAIFLSVLVALASAGSTVLYALGMVGENRLKLMVFGQFLSLLVAALLGCFQLLEGAADLLRKRFSLNTLLCFTFVLCCVDGVLCLQTLRVPCCAAFSLQVTMSLWNAYQKRNTRLGILDTMRKATRLDSICVAEDYHEQTKGLLRGEGQVEDFMDTLDQRPAPEKLLSVYCMVALGISLALGVTAGILHGLYTGIQVAAVTILAAMPASMFVMLSRPMAVLERRFHKLGTVLCGWQGVEQLCGKALFPVEHTDLFPVGTVKLNGVKFFGNRQPDAIISYAAALAAIDGGTLEPLFTHLQESRNAIHYDVHSFRAYENGGVGGEVNGEPVLMGTLSFLKEMGVEVPEGIRVSRAVCVAVDGELCGLFAVTYETDRACAAGLATLAGYRKLKVAVISDDLMLTEDFIRDRMDVRTKRIVLPEHGVRQQLREKRPEPDAPAAALITGEGLAPFAYAVTGARTLMSACKTGVAVHLVGGILGMAMMAVLAVLGATEYLTPVNLFLYELLWMVPGLLITSWTRSL